MKTSSLPITLVVIGLAVLGLSFIVRPVTNSTARKPALSSVVAPTVTLALQGQALFKAKGCAACHDHQLNGAPNLILYTPDPAFLRLWLKDPTTVQSDAMMPNLHLDDGEIEALIAFLEVHSTR